MAKLTLQQTLDKSLKTAKQYVDTELAKKVGTKRSINFVSDHTSNWTSSSAMSGKEYLGGWHGTVPNSGTSGYLSFGASGSSTLDWFIDGDYYAKENKKVYHEGNKPTPADIGAAASSHGTHVGTKIITSGYDTAFRTQTKGDANSGSYLTTIRADASGVTNAPQYGTGLAWGRGDTHGYLYLKYNSAEAYLGAGSADKLTWTKKLAFSDHTHNYAGSSSAGGAANSANILNITSGRTASANSGTVVGPNVSMILATSTMTTGKPASDGYITEYRWDNNGGWSSQFFVPNNTTGKLQYRAMDAGTWGNWNTVYSTCNKPTIADISDLRLRNVDTITTIAAPVATWASNDIKSNSIIMGGDYGGHSTNDANIVFSSSKGKIHMVIDGEFYATEGKNRVYHAGNPQPTINGLSFWTGTQAQYNAISSKSSTTVYLITG